MRLWPKVEDELYSSRFSSLRDYAENLKFITFVECLFGVTEGGTFINKRSFSVVSEYSDTLLQ